MVRYLLMLALVTLGLRAQDRSGLVGRTDGGTYISPTGAFKVAIPVLEQLGGSIDDTPNVVTFQDKFNVHVSIASFPQDATQRWELATRGVHDYLAYFFENFVFADFHQRFSGAVLQSTKFYPNLMGGALVTYVLLPGGSMFYDQIAPLGNRELPPAKRGNMLFVKNGYIYVISIELAERVIEGTAYKKTTAEEDEILLQRLNDILGKMEFSPPPTAPSATTPATQTAPTPLPKR